MVTEEVREGFETGPTDLRFTSLLLGQRGTGKTVMLNEMCDMARQSGWLVMQLDAATPGINARIAEHVEWLQDTHDTGFEPPASVEVHKRSKIGTSALGWQQGIVRKTNPKWGTRRLLSTLADHAGENGSAVLLSLDEIHSGEREELRRLSADLQHITKSEGRRLAFLGAGLPEMKHTLLQDKRMTFFRRCHRMDMPPLLPGDVALFLTRTIEDAGGEIDQRALDIMIAGSGSIPFRMQLVGHYAWRFSGAPMQPVSEPHARSAVAEAEAAYRDSVELPTWHTLSEIEQRMLQAVGAEGGTADPYQIAKRTQGAPSSLKTAEDRLIDKACLSPNDDGTVSLTGFIGAETIRELAGRLDAYIKAAAAIRPRTAALQKCNAYMPRAQAYCILGRGHAGGHRSK